MADPIREALKRLLAADDYIHAASPEYVQAREAARTALAAEPPAPGPTTDDIWELCEDHEFHLGDGFDGEASAEIMLQIIRVALTRWGHPAPAPAIPLDLDALLSPEGAYEPGTGQEDGAQLVDQLQWWAPVHGCDTLENLLDRIRGRILPHLRPPIAGIDVPGPDGDFGGLQELCEAEGVDVRIGAPLLKRAREAWGTAQTPAPAPAADGEREELAQWLDHKGRGAWPCPDGFSAEAEAEEYEMFSGLTRAAALLRQPAPVPVPVPVAERPWERPEWCDAEGRCWLGDPGDGYFIPSWWYRRPGAPSLTVSLPHWAIPVPQPPQGGEVERWPETYSRRQRAEEAERLCTKAGIDLKSPDARRLVQDAKNGMPLHDVLDLIKHWNATITTEPPTDD